MSELEESVEKQLSIFKIPPPVREFRFAPPRRWRFDFAWPDVKVALEVEGGIWGGGRHTRGAGFIADCDKYNAAALAGWRVFRITERHVKDWAAGELMQAALRG